MEIRVVDEYCGAGHLLYAENFIGAFSRGRTREEALQKLPDEIRRYRRWAEGAADDDLGYTTAVVQEKRSDALHVEDADSDVLFDSERSALDAAEYAQLKALSLRSARDFLSLYQSIPDCERELFRPRKTFYGDVPASARRMYEHTRDVNAYYFGEIGIDAPNLPDILTCREAGFRLLECRPGYLQNPVFDGSYDEQWSLRKLCRRFIWHDRIHAKAMTRSSMAVFGRDAVSDPFFLMD